MVALVSPKVELRRAGVNSYFGCCPFHDERTPSFHVSPDEKLYHCFGCSESGDPFDFVMQTEGLDFKDALEALADRFGVTLQTEEEDPAAAAARARRERLYKLLTRAATYYARYLWAAGEAGSARRYLLDRGFSEEILREFRIGFAPTGWDRILSASRQAGFTDQELRVAGLIAESRRSPGRRFDFFRGKIMFPTADARGRVRGFGGRKLGEEPGPKYVNTPDGELYHKRDVLYGIDHARAAAAKAGRMILVEGYTDVLALHQAGIRNAVGIMGTSLTNEQVAELGRLVAIVELCLDADSAGQEASMRASRMAAGAGLELRVVPLPPGSDPGDVIAREGVHALRDLVATSTPFVVFEVNRILGRAELSSAEGKDRAISALRPVLGPLRASVLRDELVRRTAGALELTESRLETLLGTGAPGAGAGTRDRPARSRPGGAPDPGQAVAPAAGFEHSIRAEREFLAMCIAVPRAGAAELAKIDHDALLTSELMRRAAQHLATRLESPLAELPREDDELSRAVADLVAHAGRDGPFTDEQLEYSRLLLEFARLDRQIARALAERRPGIAGLAGERQRVRERIGELVARIEKPDWASDGRLAPSAESDGRGAGSR
jgi:DNA primase